MGAAGQGGGAPPARRARLTREGVLDAALVVVDQHGIEALSMRGLAERLGVTPMALYNHVDSKQALLDGVAERVAAEMVIDGEARTWVARVRGWCRAIRRACLAHPNAVPLLQTTASTAPALLRPMEEVLAALADAGLPAREALEVWSALVGLTMGQVAYQLGGHLRPDARPETGGARSGAAEAVPGAAEAVPGAAAAVPAPGDGRFPRIRQARSLGTFDFDRAFERSLDLFLRGLRERLRYARTP